LLAHAIDSATKRKAAILREVLRRMQNVYESWDAWSGRADTKRAYVIVMTPGAAIVSVVFFCCWRVVSRAAESRDRRPRHPRSDTRADDLRPSTRRLFPHAR
jgi:hypothetical protein